MSRSWHRLLKSVYRREPITSFILTVGTVDAVMGGVGHHGSLLLLGLGVMSVAIALRILKSRQQPIEAPVRAPIHYLPAARKESALPMLTMSRKRSPK